MAKLQNARYPTVVEVIGQRGRCEALVRSTGEIVKRRETGGHGVAGTIKPGLTVAQLVEIWARKYAGARIVAHASPETVILPADKWERRQKARTAAREKDRTERDRMLASLPEAYRTTDLFTVRATYETVKYAVMTTMFCRFHDCGAILDVDRAMVVQNKAMCAGHRNVDHGVVADPVPGYGIAFDGPMLRAALRAR
jgi:hypothetical protein